MTDFRALNDIVINLTGLLLLCELVALLYCNSLDGDFVWDDTNVTEVLMPEILKHDREN